MNDHQVQLIRKHEDAVREWFDFYNGRGPELDPEDELDWHSLLIGFLAAQDVDRDDVRELASVLWYGHENEVRACWKESTCP